MKLVLATANADKAREIVDALGPGWDVVPRPASVPEVDETGTTLEENARLKAIAASEACFGLAIASDGGVQVPSLGAAWSGLFTGRAGSGSF